MDNLQDIVAESAVLAGLYQYGENAYYEINEIITKDCFTDKSNIALFECLDHLFKNGTKVVDYASLMSVANSLGYGWLFELNEELRHIKGIINIHIDFSNIGNLAKRLRKFLITKQLIHIGHDINKELYQITGTETIGEILSKVEEPIFDYTLKLNSANNDIIQLNNEVDNLFNKIEQHPTDIIGLSSGFPKWDQAIGSGLRNKTISIVCGRAKSAKSIFGACVALNVAAKGVPCLVLDSEMDYSTWIIRIASNFLYKNNQLITTNELESGKYTKYKKNKSAVDKFKEEFKKYPITYVNVSNNTFDQVLSIIKRWRYKTQGQVLVIYDYLKVTAQEELDKNVAEFQRIGFLTIGLHNLAVKYDFPILTFAQLNRSGEENEAQSAIAFSDRIIHTVTNCSFIKDKNDLEIADDGIENGFKKLVVIATRFGKGLNRGDYINLNFRGEYAHIAEIGTKFETKILQKREQEVKELKKSENEISLDDI